MRTEIFKYRPPPHVTARPVILAPSSGLEEHFRWAGTQQVIMTRGETAIFDISPNLKPPPRFLVEHLKLLTNNKIRYLNIAAKRARNWAYIVKVCLLLLLPLINNAYDQGLAPALRCN